MDMAIASRKFGPAALKRIIYCQMYLNVLLLSDITMPQGKYIETSAYNGDRDALHSVHSSHCVHQTRPNEKAWREWRRFLQMLCQRDSTHILKEPLGVWTVKGGTYARQWKLLYSRHDNTIYHHTALGYSVHTKLWHDYDKEIDDHCDELPPDAVPIEIRETPTTWIRPQCPIPHDAEQDAPEVTS